MARERSFSLSICYVLCLCCMTSKADIVDSLRNSMFTATTDTARIQAINQYANALVSINGDSALHYGNQAALLAKQKNYPKEEAFAYNLLGTAYINKSDYPNALEYYVKGLHIRESIHYSKGIAGSLNNIGNVYLQLKEPDKALNYFLKAMEINIRIDNKAWQAINVGNIGIIYYNKKDFAKALDYFTKALDINTQIGNAHGIASMMDDIANCYGETGKPEEAIQLHRKTIKLFREQHDDVARVTSMINMAACFMNIHKYDSATIYLKKGIADAKIIGITQKVMEGEYNLYLIRQGENKPAEALSHYLLFIQARDSISNASVTKQIAQKEMQFVLDKKEVEQKSKEMEENIRHQEEIKHQKTITWSISFGLILMLAFSLVLFNRFRVISNQKNIIEEQRNIVSEKNKAILDSINYAKRIQDAIIPDHDHFTGQFREAFVLFKPKDIVAGDFYWGKKLHEHLLIFAVADCTGHGVPGALVSIICSNALNTTVNELLLTQPAKILDSVNTIVMGAFKKNNNEVRDGMDISICLLNTKTKQLQWAGANNPLWIIRKQELMEYKADRQPIGEHVIPRPFTNHTIQLEDNDALYLFSDGYSDQFGGETNKKFKSANLKKLFLKIKDEPMNKQLVLVKEELMNWMGNNEQTDDICTIGIRI
jgi:serine phosphatase RsbU (regulator of sigma subunit)/Tfp pilus assembly protein PilF